MQINLHWSEVIFGTPSTLAGGGEGRPQSLGSLVLSG